MAAQQEIAVAAQHPTETWAALIGSLTAIVALVGILYHRMNKDIEGTVKQLENGQIAFIGIGKELVKIGERIQNLENNGNIDDADMGKLATDIRLLENRLLIIETEHKRCVGIVEGLKK